MLAVQPQSRRLELEDVDLERIAGLGAGDLDRPVHLVDPLEVERAEVGGRRVGRQLAVRRVEAVERDHDRPSRPSPPAGWPGPRRGGSGRDGRGWTGVSTLTSCGAPARSSRRRPREWLGGRLGGRFALALAHGLADRA